MSDSTPNTNGYHSLLDEYEAFDRQCQEEMYTDVVDLWSIADALAEALRSLLPPSQPDATDS